MNSVGNAIYPDWGKATAAKINTSYHVNAEQYVLSQRFAESDMHDADAMMLIDQESAYSQCGMKIKSDLLGKRNFDGFSMLGSL